MTVPKIRSKPQRLTKALLKERKAALMRYIAQVKAMNVDDANIEARRVCNSIKSTSDEVGLKLWLVRAFIDDHTLPDPELW